MNSTLRTGIVQAQLSRPLSGHNGTSGLQNHSVGEHYPWSVVVISSDRGGWGRRDYFQAWNLITGTKGVFRNDYETAENDITVELGHAALAEQRGRAFDAALDILRSEG